MLRSNKKLTLKTPIILKTFLFFIIVIAFFGVFFYIIFFYNIEGRCFQENSGEFMNLEKGAEIECVVTGRNLWGNLTGSWGLETLDKKTLHRLPLVAYYKFRITGSRPLFNPSLFYPLSWFFMDLERNQVRKEVAKEFEEKVGSEPEETRQYYFPANDRFRVGEIVPLVVKISDAKEEIQIRLNDKSVPYGRIEKGNLFIYLIKPHEPGEIKFAYPDEDIEKSIGSEGPKAFPAFVER